MAASARAGGRGGDRRGGGAPRRLRAARVHGRRLPAAPRVRQAERPLRRARGASGRRSGAAPAPATPSRRRDPRRPPAAARRPRRRRPRRQHAARCHGRRHQPGAAAGGAAGRRRWIVDRLSRPGPRRRLPPAPRRRDVAGRRPAPALEAAGRRRARVVRGRARRRLHDRAAPATARWSPPTTSPPAANAGRNGWDALFSRSDGRRRPARDADLCRRHPLRARRGRRAARAAGRLRHARVAHQHPRRRRRREPAVGHVRRAARSSTAR